MADKADVFLCEAGSATPGEHHLTMRQACEVGRQAGVGTLLITHIPNGQRSDLPPASGDLAVEIVKAGGEWHIAG